MQRIISADSFALFALIVTFFLLLFPLSPLILFNFCFLLFALYAFRFMLTIYATAVL